jgi:hypothetical protein
VGAGGQILFGEPVTGVSLGTERTFLTIPSAADMDGDGDLDLFYPAVPVTVSTTPSGNYYESEDPNSAGFYVLENDGGTLVDGAGQTLAGLLAVEDVFDDLYLNGSASATYIDYRINGGLSFGDVDGDGDLDVVALALYERTSEGTYLAAQVLRFVENTGSGTSPSFASPVVVPYALAAGGSSDTATTYLYSHLTPADIDADGDIDFVGVGAVNDYTASSAGFSGLVLVENREGTLVIVDPDWQIEATSDLYARDGDYSEHLSDAAFLDFDGDGDLDLLVAIVGAYYRYDPTDPLFAKFRLFENTGTASAPSFNTDSSDVNPGGLSASIEVTGLGDLYRPLAVPFDLDGDGDLDIVTGVRHAYTGYRGVYTYGSYAGGTVIRYTENRDIDFQ